MHTCLAKYSAIQQGFTSANIISHIVAPSWSMTNPVQAPGPHRNTARQAMDGLWTEVCGQQKQSNDPGNNHHILNTPIIGRR